MSLKILPEELTRRLLYGEEDILTPKVQAEQGLRDTTPCPRCGGCFHKILDPDRMFTPDRALPRFFHKCVDCGYTYDPHSGLVIATGNPAKVEDPFEIKPKDD